MNDETTLSEPRHDVGVAEAGAHGVADCQRNHIIGNAVAGKGPAGTRRKAAAAVSTAPALPAQPRRSIFAWPRAATSQTRHDQSLST